MPKPNKKRGVLYVVWNRGKSPKHDAAMRRSIESLHATNADLGIHIHELPPKARLIDKAGMYDWSPFEETLYLDIDTVVLDRLDFGFEKAALHHVAVTIAPAAYARRYPRMITGDTVEYNTGVVFWKKCAETDRLFKEWRRLAEAEDSARAAPGEQVVPGDCNDQASFAKAVDTLGFVPFTLPANWNFRPQFTRSFFGPLKVWHDYEDVPPEVRSISDSMRGTHDLRFVFLG